MYFIIYLKQILSNEIIILFLIISYSLIFRTSKELKRENFHKDYKIVKTTGILYGILAIAVAVVLNI
nr:CLC_0170 family protein [Sedimentibacter sp.]